MRVVQVNAVLKRVAQKGLSQASSRDVGRLAEAVWYGNTVPDLRELSSAALRDAAYLVDRLARYNVVSVERQKQLLEVLKTVPSSNESATSSPQTRDRLAQKWGASADLHQFSDVLLPLQTRHAALARTKTKSR